MRTEITYYAFDDTEFDNETECLLYEQSLHRMAHGVQFFNEDRKFMRQPELEDIEKKTLYRKMELHCAEPSPGHRFTEQQQEILETDPVLRDLAYRRDALLKKKFFIQGYGELPPEV